MPNFKIQNFSKCPEVLSSATARSQFMRGRGENLAPHLFFNRQAAPGLVGSFFGRSSKFLVGDFLLISEWGLSGDLWDFPGVF